MASYAKVATKILKYLNDCYENGLEPSIDSLNANMLGISDRQFYQTLKMLKDDGYVKGIELLDVIPPEMSQINHPRSWYITSTGIQYLEENSLIRKAYNTLKEAKDWLPLIRQALVMSAFLFGGGTMKELNKAEEKERLAEYGASLTITKTEQKYVSMMFLQSFQFYYTKRQSVRLALFLYAFLVFEQ